LLDVNCSITNQITFISLPYYAEACNKLAGPISGSYS